MGGFWTVLIAGVLYGATHTLLASSGVKRLAVRWMGIRAYQRYYRIGYAVVAGGLFLPILVMMAVLPDRTIYTIPFPFRYLTLALQGMALVGILIAVMQTGALRFIGLEQLAEGSWQGDEHLVTGGFYRYVRHPMYSFSLALLWLAPTMTWNLLAMALSLSAYMLAGAYWSEEPKMIQKFGEAYREYRKKTPMIVPGLRIKALSHGTISKMFRD